jgi:hypothetical protein
MKKSLWQWEKHDVVNYLISNFLETEVEFTTESLIKQMNKSKHDHYYFGYDDKVISKHLSDLKSDGYLSVRYISVDMKPEEHYFQKLANTNRYTYKDKWRTRWGSKTVAIYKMVSRNEKIENILK